jgi:hypothetical protein
MRIRNKILTRDNLIKLSILMIVPLQLSLNIVDDVKESIGNVLSATSPWTQTDWSGGQSSAIVTGTVNTYLSESEINTIAPYNLTLSQTNGWPVDMADWTKRTLITINNTLSEQTNYQVRIPVTYDADMQPDFDDLRFTNSSGTSLDYWLEKKVDSTSAIVWVEVDTLTASGDTLIYMYYGNGASTSSSSGLNTFILFDDFTADTLDPKWTVGGTNVYSLNNDKLTLGPGSSGWNQAIYGTDLMQRSDLSFDLKYKWTSANGSYDALMFGWKDNTASASYTSLIYGYYNSGTGTCTINCPVNVYESGSNRSPVTGTWTVNQDYLVRVRMRSTGGAFYDQSTDFGNTWNTSYTSTFSTVTNIRPAWTLYSGYHEFDDVRVRKWLTTEPTSGFGTEESKFQPQGSLISNVMDAGVSMDWGLLTYASSGAGSVTVKIRTDNSEDMSGATAWGTCNAITSGTDISTNNCVTDSDRYIQYEVTLQPSGATTPVFEDISIAFVPSDQVPPEVNATDVAISGLTNSGDWYATEPTITWTEGVDDLNGNGILGHCVAIDEAEPDSSNGLNPAMASGVLTGKNDGVSQDYCPYIVVGDQLDVSAVAGLDLTAGKQYYISIKAVDIAGNIYTGTDETWKDLLSFKYDNQAPTAPFYISLPANFLSSKDVVVTWPVGVGGADDLHSGLAGLQYRIGDSGTWYGDLHTGTEDINDLLINDGSYVTDETYDYPELVEGNNLIYVRAVDNLGNVTAPENYVKGLLKLNTVAPSPVRNLTVDPLNADVNAYTFTWDVPSTYTGSSAGITYCYAVNAIPSVSNCTFTEAGVTSLGPDAFATQPGENTMYVVAKDEAGNINYATYSEPGSSVTYTYSGTAPGITQNLDVADISVKATENWRLVLSWDQPTNVGAGISYYNIYRSGTTSSCNGNFAAFTKVGSSTSTSYIDPNLEQKLYNYCIKACDSANNCSASSGTVGRLPTGKFTEPAELLSPPEVVSFTTRKAVINWITDRVSDSSIQYGLESGVYFEAEVANSNQLAIHTIPLNNLEPGTTYFYRAKWTDVDGNTGVSEEKTFSTLPAPTISNTTTTNITTNSAIVTFLVRNSVEATILYGLSENYGGSQTIPTSTIESTYSVQLTNLQEGTLYNYKLNLLDIDGNNYTYFENHQFNTLPYPRVQDIQVQEVKNSAQPTVDVNWTSNVPISTQVTYYPLDNVDQKRDKLDVELKTEHETSISELQPNRRYGMIITGRDAIGNQAVSDEYQFTTAADSRPPAISNIKVETRVSNTSTGEQAQTQLIITWDTDEEATSQIEYGEGANGTYTQRSLVDDNLTFNHLVIVNNLRPSSVYHFRVVSADSAGNESTGKNVVTITAQVSENPLDIIISRLTEVFGFIR